MRRDCEHGSLARSCEVCDLRAEVVRLTDGIRSIAARRCLCHGHTINRHGGPCCGVAGGRCVTCEARSLLDVMDDATADLLIGELDAMESVDREDGQ